MGSIPMKQDELDFSDVQGLVRFGYGKMTRSSYALLRVKDPAAARQVVADGAGHERGHDESASFRRAPGCIHRARPGGDRHAGICH